MKRSKRDESDDGGIVRVAPLLPIVGLLQSRGIALTNLLADVGIAPTSFDAGDNRIPFRSAGTLLQRCAEAAACPHFGLLVGAQTDVATLGRVGALMQQSPTVDAALRSLVLHLHLQNRGAVPVYRIEGERASLGYVIYQRDMPGTVPVYDLVAALIANMLRTLCGAAWRATTVALAHAPPVDVRPYKRCFRDAALQFDADTTAVTFERRWVERELPGSDAALFALLSQEMSAESRERLDPLEWVRIALRTMIPTGRASESSIAGLIGVPVRTLRRQLVAEGASFRALSNETRYEIARQLLVDTRMPIADIANVLEYADASAFTRAFRKWTSVSPSAWRSNNGRLSGGTAAR
jgi:AraC-like DNA-binding protein